MAFSFNKSQSADERETQQNALNILCERQIVAYQAMITKFTSLYDQKLADHALKLENIAEKFRKLNDEICETQQALDETSYHQTETWNSKFDAYQKNHQAIITEMVNQAVASSLQAERDRRQDDEPQVKALNLGQQLYDSLRERLERFSGQALTESYDPATIQEVIESMPPGKQQLVKDKLHWGNIHEVTLAFVSLQQIPLAHCIVTYDEVLAKTLEAKIFGPDKMFGREKNYRAFLEILDLNKELMMDSDPSFLLSSAKIMFSEHEEH